MSDFASRRDPACIYFTRLTVSEDGLYLPVPHECRSRFLTAYSDVPAIRAIHRAYADCFGLDLLDEMQFPAAKDIDRRILEAGMYAAFAFFLEHSCNLHPKALAFYSSGIAPALMFAHVLSPAAYLTTLAPFHAANRAAYVAVEKRLHLAQTRLEADSGEDLESFVECALADPALKSRVYIKDRRHRHTLLVAGIRPEVERLRSMAMQAFASVASQNPKLVDTSSAHLPLYDHAPLRAMLDDVRFGVPRFTLIGIDGQILLAGSDDHAAPGGARRNRTDGYRQGDQGRRETV